MIHGFTGSPAEMRRIANYLYERGFTVAAPLLPGHGTRPEDLNRVSWREWTATAEDGLRKLSERCGAVFVAGLSLGALLALNLAAQHPDLPGVVVFSPALLVRNRLARLVPIGKYFVRLFPKSSRDPTDLESGPQTWSYRFYPTFGVHEAGKLIREVRRRLPEVVSPLLIVHSRLDRNVRPEGAQIVYDRAGSTDKELLMLDSSGHTLTVDREWERVAEVTYRFIQGHSPGAARQRRA